MALMNRCDLLCLFYQDDIMAEVVFWPGVAQNCSGNTQFALNSIEMASHRERKQQTRTCILQEKRFQEMTRQIQSFPYFSEAVNETQSSADFQSTLISERSRNFDTDGPLSDVFLLQNQRKKL